MKWFVKGDWNIPARKPLAVNSVFFVYSLCILAWIFQRDIPNGAVTLMSFVVPTVVVSYFGSSAIEAIKAKEDDKDA